jgi:hypothetical protein
VTSRSSRAPLLLVVALLAALVFSIAHASDAKAAGGSPGGEQLCPPWAPILRVNVLGSSYCSSYDDHGDVVGSIPAGTYDEHGCPPWRPHWHESVLGVGYCSARLDDGSEDPWLPPAPPRELLLMLTFDRAVSSNMASIVAVADPAADAAEEAPPADTASPPDDPAPEDEPS